MPAARFAPGPQSEPPDQVILRICKLYFGQKYEWIGRFTPRALVHIPLSGGAGSSECVGVALLSQVWGGKYPPVVAP
jgi:hypothetical protein